MAVVYTVNYRSGVSPVDVARMDLAWHHGILYHLETWLELAEVSTVVRTHSPEMATAIGEFIDYHLDV